MRILFIRGSEAVRGHFRGQGEFQSKNAETPVLVFSMENPNSPSNFDNTNTSNNSNRTVRFTGIYNNEK